MDDMWKMMFGSAVRHVATGLAGYMLAHQFANSNQANDIALGVVALGAVGWSWWQKIGHARAIALLNQASVPAAKVAVLIACLCALDVTLGRAADAQTAVAPAAIPAVAPVPALSVADVTTLPAPKSNVFGSLFTGYSGSGPYWGITSAATATTPTINGVAATGLQTFGGSIGGLFGWAWGSGNIGYALEQDVWWNNIGGSSTCSGASCSLTSRWSFEQRAIAMTPISNLLSMFPAFNLPNLPAMPTLPAGVTQASSNPYLMVGLHEDDVSASYGISTGRAWQIAPGFGVGNLIMLSNKVALDLWGEYIPAGLGFAVGPGVSATQGPQWKIGMAVKW